MVLEGRVPGQAQAPSRKRDRRPWVHEPLARGGETALSPERTRASARVPEGGGPAGGTVGSPRVKRAGSLKAVRAVSCRPAGRMVAPSPPPAVLRRPARGEHLVSTWLAPPTPYPANHRSRCRCQTGQSFQLVATLSRPGLLRRPEAKGFSRRTRLRLDRRTRGCAACGRAAAYHVSR